MLVKYTNGKVEKVFLDYSKMKKLIPNDWVRTIKKHLDRLEAAECFGDFLDLGLGKPEYLQGYEDVRYSLHVAPNVRLIISLDTEPENVRERTKVVVKGVCDYHGSKTTWYIP